MSVKIPILSLRYFISINPHLAFNEIRHSNHPESDAIIAYLYDISLIQHKTALALLEYLQHCGNIGPNKADSVLLRDETSIVMKAELIISYLKATIEKNIALIAAIHSLPSPTDLKSHKKRLELLRRRIPDTIRTTPYGELIFEFIGSEHLEELNKYRTAILHKKGLAQLQPHSFTKNEMFLDLPFGEIFSFLHHQHVKNSSVFLSSLALLTGR